MAADHPNEMSDEERDAFLGAGGTGVLSLDTAGDEPPHAVPVSYGYDEVTGTFYFRLAVGPDSGKGDLADRPATFVTHDRPEERWESVVASGRLERVDEAAIAAETLAGLRRVDLRYVDAFAAPTRSVEFEFYRLVPAEIGARREASTRE